MADTKPDPCVIPYLLYRDVANAIAWLTNVLGLHERFRATADDGSANHAEMELGDCGVVMLGCPGPDYRNPKQLGYHTQLQYVTVNDVEAHYAHARTAGAVIISELEDKDYGRAYALEDPEGHQWHVAQAR